MVAISFTKFTNNLSVSPLFVAMVTWYLTIYKQKIPSYKISKCLFEHLPGLDLLLFNLAVSLSSAHRSNISLYQIKSQLVQMFRNALKSKDKLKNRQKSNKIRERIFNGLRSAWVQLVYIYIYICTYVNIK